MVALPKIVPMSEEGKFRVNLVITSSILFSIIVGAWVLTVNVVQKYDAIDNKIDTLTQKIEKLENRSGAVDDLSKRIDAQGQHIITDEQREMNAESKVDALTSLLNQFMGSIRSGVQPASSPRPSPSPP